MFSLGIIQYYGSTYDIDVQNFIDATHISDLTEKNALNNLVISWKSAGLWNKTKIIYPHVGSSSTTNKFNLKNPLDSDSAYRNTFSGGLTFSATGIKGNGINGVGNTHFNPNNLSLLEMCIGICIRNNVNESTSDFFSNLSSETSLYSRYSGLCYIALNSQEFSKSNSDSSGLWIINRDVNNIKTYRNNILFLENNTLITSITNYAILYPGSNGYPSREYSFFFIAEKLNSTEISDANIIINTFNTALSR